MNKYKKYCPNVFVAECDEEHEKGDTIEIETRYGKVNEHIVHNFLGNVNGSYLYSITRADGFTTQTRAENKANCYKEWADSADNKSQEFYERSNKDRDFLVLGEPIKVGHHSERRHRKMIDNAWDNTRKSVEMADKAKAHEKRAKYWESRANDINLSMPESLDYYDHMLEQAIKKHTFLKDNPEARTHSYELTYAKKEVNETKKKLALAVKLWGDKPEVSA